MIYQPVEGSNTHLGGIRDGKGRIQRNAGLAYHLQISVCITLLGNYTLPPIKVSWLSSGNASSTTTGRLEPMLPALRRLPREGSSEAGFGWLPRLER